MSWNIDNAHTRAVFSARHMMVSNVHGEFNGVSGMVDFDPDNPANTTVDVQIDASSINTRKHSVTRISNHQIFWMLKDTQACRSRASASRSWMQITVAWWAT